MSTKHVIEIHGLFFNALYNMDNNLISVFAYIPLVRSYLILSECCMFEIHFNFQLFKYRLD